MLKKLAYAAVLSSLGVLSAQALPAAPVPAPLEISGDLTLVADGCGRGYYRNAYGRCRPMGGGGGGAVMVVPGVAIVPPVVVAPRGNRGCPPGMWRNRHGRCVY
jgi:hypothetical protein